MEGLKIEAAYSGTDIKPAESGIYYIGRIGAWKTWHFSPRAISKIGGNKGRRYPLRMHQWHTETQHLEDNNEIPKVMVHAGHINETTRLPIPIG